MERLLRSGVVQAKLKVNGPGDIYEHEADRIAGQVLATAASAPAGRAASRMAGQPADQTATAPASVEHALASPGKPFEPVLRQEMEQGFGYDFSRVRLHLGAAAEQSARDVNARAYTLGHDLVFGAGEFKPETRQGRQLLAHELTHVVQQSRGGPVPTFAASAPHEREAHAAARAVAGGLPSGQVTCHTGIGIARASQPDVTRDFELELERLKNEALGILAEEGISSPVARESVGKPKRTPSPRINDVVRELSRVAGDPGSPHRGQAQKILDRIRDTQGALRDLNAERTAQRRPGPSRRQLERGEGTRTRTRRGGPRGGGPPPNPEFQQSSKTTSKGPAATGSGRSKATPKPGTGGTKPPSQATSPTTSTATPTGRVSGEIEVAPPSGGPGKTVTTPGSESTGSRARMGGLAKGVGGAVGSAIASLIVAFIGGQIQQYFDNKRIQKALNEMQPEIQAALNRRQGEIEKLLQQTHMTQTIYANVQVDVTYSFMIDPELGAGPMVDYQDTKLIGVGVSPQDITREDWVRETFIGGHDDHHRYTYSVPIAEPAALVLPFIRNVHNLLGGIRSDLMAARGGTRGEAVALDDLNVAQQATDFTDRSSFQNKTAAERFHLTVDAITGSLDVLEGPSRENPSLHSLRGRLMMVKSMVNGLASRWLVMVGEYGSS